MISNYLKTTWRNLLKNKIFFTVNVLGLAVGMSACLLIFQYVRYERSYDDFHDKGENIYRVGVAWYHPNGELEEKLAGNFGAAGAAISSEIPEVEAFARLRPWFGKTMIKHGDIALPQEGIYFADPTVFTLFSFPPLQGDPVAGLGDPNAAVISETIAVKYFGNEDPLGKVIELQQESTVRQFTVRAVTQDVPPNSHIQFDVLLSYSHLGEFAETDWGFSIVNTYLLVQAGTDPIVLQKKLQQVLRKHRETAMENSVGEVSFILQPLRDIYLHSDLRGESVPTGNGQMLYFISLIGALILCIAYANYINLSTARSMQRAREVGVRKVAGATKTALVLQFMQDSFLLNILAAIVALALTQAAQQPFSLLTGQPAFFAADQPAKVWVLALSLLIVGSISSGIYPAIVLSSFKPIAALKGNILQSAQGHGLRKYLVIFQFAVSVGLIGVTLLIHRQLSFMRSQELGVDIGQVVVIRAPVVTDPTFSTKAESFRQSLMRVPGVVGVTASTEVPGGNIIWSNDLIHRKDVPGQYITSNYILGVDYDFVKTYDLRLVAGRDFDEAFGTDKRGLIINEKAALLMGFETPGKAVGQPMIWDQEVGSVDYEIIGVIKNFHQRGLRHDYDPMILTLEHQQESYYSCKLAGGDPGQKLEAMRRAYTAFFPGNPFDYFFLDDYYDEQYKADQRFGLVFLLSSGLAIFVACLGLFGLTTFITSQRTKEIGIRKVLGASVRAIVSLLSLNFLRLVVVASLLATPLTYLVMQEWLKNYAFRTDIGLLLLLLPIVTVMLIAIVTVSFQTVHAALANPAEAIRNE